MAVGIGAAVTSLGAMAVKSAEATDRIDKLSQQLGLSRQGFQEWDYILSQNGVSIDSMKGGMKTLTNMTDDLRKGTATATDAFGRLGLSMNDIDGKSQEEVFSMVVNSLQSVEDETQRAALANDLLGRSGAELAPLLNAGADSAENLRNKANELGLILDDKTIDAGVELTDTMDSAKRSLGTLATEIGAEVMPVVQDLLDWVIENMPTIKETAKDAFDKISDAIDWVKQNADWLIPVLGGLFAAFMAFKALTLINTLMLAFQAAQVKIAASGGVMNAVMAANPLGAIALAIGVAVAAGVLLYKNWDKIKEVASSLWKSIKTTFGNIRDFITGIFEGFRNVIKLPKLIVEGSLNPVKWLKQGLPKLKVKWNAEGAIFDSPTIFGTQYGYQGVGEAGAEAIMPISKLQDMIDWNKGDGIDYERMGTIIKKSLQGMTIVLDRKEVGSFVDARIIKGVV